MKREEFKLFKNGILVKRSSREDETYLGVEGDNWFIDLNTSSIERNELEYLFNYYRDNIDKSWTDDNFVDCCTDINYINRYIVECQKACIDFILLFCETEKKYPIWQSVNDVVSNDDMEFIGYDYAYAGGSFYSCIFNDVLSRRIPELHDIKLNKYGLIKSEEEIYRFIKLREELKSTLPPYTFEEGDFIVYKLWKYVGRIPLEG